MIFKEDSRNDNKNLIEYYFELVFLKFLITPFSLFKSRLSILLLIVFTPWQNLICLSSEK